MTTPPPEKHQDNALECDLLIVGAGPAGLATAIKAKQLANVRHMDLNVMVLEKANEVGGHILSGAVFDPRCLDEIVPDWRDNKALFDTPVTNDTLLLLTPKKAFSIPNIMRPTLTINNQDNFIISLANLCRFLAQKATELDIDILPGFAGAHILYSHENKVIGVVTGDTGRDSNNAPTDDFEEGTPIYAPYTILAEGCRGSLTQEIINKFQLDCDTKGQTYGLGIKEIWSIDPQKHRPGTVIHTIGYPFDNNVWAGGFIYHMQEKNQISLGYVVGLDYKNPYLSPYEEFQVFKGHPQISSLLEGGTPLSYGARALNEGGLQSIPHLTQKGVLLVGCSAGFLNVGRIKGSHTAIQSGVIAAKHIIEALSQSHFHENLTRYEDDIRHSSIVKELKQVRNLRPAASRFGMIGGLLFGGIDLFLGGKLPFTLSHPHKDNKVTLTKDKVTPRHYPKHDGKITLDLKTALALSHTDHNPNQPVHLKLKDPKTAININLKNFAGLEQYYCPAAVYQYIEDDKHNMALRIHAQNCLHCKTCDIKDPTQNIKWTPPQGGGGPNYSNM